MIVIIFTLNVKSILRERFMKIHIENSHSIEFDWIKKKHQHQVHPSEWQCNEWMSFTEINSKIFVHSTSNAVKQLYLHSDEVSSLIYKRVLKQNRICKHEQNEQNRAEWMGCTPNEKINNSRHFDQLQLRKLRQVGGGERKRVNQQLNFWYQSTTLLCIALFACIWCDNDKLSCVCRTANIIYTQRERERKKKREREKRHTYKVLVWMHRLL